MKRIDFNQPGGFPLSTQILDALQEAYKNFNVHGAMAGELAIILGCEVGGGGFVTDGFVHINGELLPFVGGQLSTDVVIVETADSRGFEDGSSKSVIYNRYATFGVGSGSNPWASFRRPLTLFQLEDRLLKVEKATPIGLVAIWDRPAQEIPEGWVEHTEMRGNVPVGHNSGDTNFGSLGNTVGAKEITLDITQIPAHYHEQGSEGLYSDYGGGVVMGDRNYINGPHTSYRNQRTTSKGGGQGHSNIQPSRIVKFIRFVGIN